MMLSDQCDLWLQEHEYQQIKPTNATSHVNCRRIASTSDEWADVPPRHPIDKDETVRKKNRENETENMIVCNRTTTVRFSLYAW